jgi:hypothetical protein
MVVTGPRTKSYLEAVRSKAARRVRWIRSQKDNRFLDCEALNGAAAHSLAAHQMQPVVVKQAPQQQARPAPPRRHKNFVSRWAR